MGSNQPSNAGSGPLNTELTRRAALAVLAAGILVPSHFKFVATRGPAVSRGTVQEPLHYASLADVARLIETRKLASADLTQQLLQRIAAVDGSLSSYVTVTGDAAMTSARRVDGEIQAGRYRGPLHGVPIAVKDLCYSRGVRTMAGTKVLSNVVPDSTRPLWQDWRPRARLFSASSRAAKAPMGPIAPGSKSP